MVRTCGKDGGGSNGEKDIWGTPRWKKEGW
jgi:hypothetical protein